VFYGDSLYDDLERSDVRRDGYLSRSSNSALLAIAEQDWESCVSPLSRQLNAFKEIHRQSSAPNADKSFTGGSFDVTREFPTGTHTKVNASNDINRQMDGMEKVATLITTPPRRPHPPNRIVLLVIITIAAFTAIVSGANASQPWVRLTSRMVPTHLTPGGEGEIILQTINLGNAETAGPYSFSADLPKGLKLEGVQFFAPSSEPRATDLGPSGPTSFFNLCKLTSSSVRCSSEAALELGPGEFLNFEFLFPVVPYDFLEMRLKVKDEGAISGALAETQFVGGGALARTLKRGVEISSSPAGFGVGEFVLQPEAEGGEADTLAGSHPYQLTTALKC